VTRIRRNSYRMRESTQMYRGEVHVTKYQNYGIKGPSFHEGSEEVRSLRPSQPRVILITLIQIVISFITS
jgi:hypothetical protein